MKQVHSTDVECAPLYVYKLPDGTNNVLLTDRLIFATNDVENLVTIISSQLSECELEDQSVSIIKLFMNQESSEEKSK